MTTHNGKGVILQELILRSLEECDASISEVADYIGYNRSTLYNWLRTNKKNWYPRDLFIMSEFLINRGVLFRPENEFFRVKLDSLEEYSEYIPLTIGEQADYFGMSRNEYRMLDLKNIDNIQKYKEMINEYTLFKVEESYY